MAIIHNIPIVPMTFLVIVGTVMTYGLFSPVLARLLGLAGTPALVVGRTVVLGELDTATLDQIIALERDGGWRAVCDAQETG